MLNWNSMGFSFILLLNSKILFTVTEQSVLHSSTICYFYYNKCVLEEYTESLILTWMFSNFKFEKETE